MNKTRPSTTRKFRSRVYLGSILLTLLRTCATLGNSSRGATARGRVVLAASCWRELGRRSALRLAETGSWDEVVCSWRVEPQHPIAKTNRGLGDGLSRDVRVIS